MQQKARRIFLLLPFFLASASAHPSIFSSFHSLAWHKSIDRMAMVLSNYVFVETQRELKHVALRNSLVFQEGRLRGYVAEDCAFESLKQDLKGTEASILRRVNYTTATNKRGEVDLVVVDKDSTFSVLEVKAAKDAEYARWQAKKQLGRFLGETKLGSIFKWKSGLHTRLLPEVFDEQALDCFLVTYKGEYTADKTYGLKIIELPYTREEMEEITKLVASRVKGKIAMPDPSPAAALGRAV